MIPVFVKIGIMACTVVEKLKLVRHKLEGYKLEKHMLESSVVDPDPHGSGTFPWLRIRNYCSGSGSSKK